MSFLVATPIPSKEGRNKLEVGQSKPEAMVATPIPSKEGRNLARAVSTAGD